MDATTSEPGPVTRDEQLAAQREVVAGRVCCGLGQTVRCVCRNSVKCPRHFPRGVCVGSHD